MNDKVHYYDPAGCSPAGMSAKSCPGDPVSISGLAIAAERIDLAIDQLMDQGHRLEQKLTPAIQHAPPASDSGGKSATPDRSPVSPLTDRLHGYADRIEAAAFYLRLLNGRIDI